MIYNLIEHVDRLEQVQFERIMDWSKNPEGRDINEMMQMAKAQYENIRVIDWHIDII
ncbi:MAG: hypothetical protein IPG67_18005 [Acidobacteria bacterium]|nr:hypothetical protein [Acidobacteriota bacterium]